MRAMSEYVTESEARAVDRWEVGSCLRMVCKTSGWDFIPNLGGTVAEGTPTKVSCYSWNIEQLLTGRAQGSSGLRRKQK